METNDILNQVKDVLATKNQADIERLKELLDFLEQIKTKAREEIEGSENASLVKMEEIELKKEEMEHKERMRSMDLGQVLPDKREFAKAHSAIWASAVIGLLVPLAFVGAGITTTVLVLRAPGEGTVEIFEIILDRHVALIPFVWTVCGLLSLLVTWLSLRTIRRAREVMVPLPRTITTPLERSGTEVPNLAKGETYGSGKN
jgi:hypothetical protein